MTKINTFALETMLASTIMKAERSRQTNFRPVPVNHAAIEAAEKARKEQEEKARAIRREAATIRRRGW